MLRVLVSCVVGVLLWTVSLPISVAAIEREANNTPSSVVINKDSAVQVTPSTERATGLAYSMWQSKFWSYVACITGVGVPLGVAVAIASLPATWPNLYKWAIKHPIGESQLAMRYVTKVRAACARYFES